MIRASEHFVRLSGLTSGLQLIFSVQDQIRSIRPRKDLCTINVKTSDNFLLFSSVLNQSHFLNGADVLKVHMLLNCYFTCSGPPSVKDVFRVFAFPFASDTNWTKQIILLSANSGFCEG